MFLNLSNIHSLTEVVERIYMHASIYEKGMKEEQSLVGALVDVHGRYCLITFACSVE